ncbi:jerky protein-like protein [Trichinella spiralis]|uniref:jerky protein-like protein n=1 Tax=Trichinella spiralis TaxID=6334 RepID=UPI0001EFBA92|nr:jerky protein-like protein [Trichinella spiralis]
MGLSTVIAIYRSRPQLTDFVQYMDTSSSCSSRKWIKKVASDATELDIDNFVASSGWLRNFKSRHGIRELKIHGEKLSADITYIHFEKLEKFDQPKIRLSERAQKPNVRIIRVPLYLK